MRIGLGLGIGPGASSGTPETLLAQAAAHSSTIAVYDVRDTTGLFRDNGAGNPVQGSGHTVRGISSLVGMGGSTFADWAAAQSVVNTSAGSWTSAGTAGRIDVVSASSVRGYRDAGGAGVARLAVSAGWYYIEGTLADYDWTGAPLTNNVIIQGDGQLARRVLYLPGYSNGTAIKGICYSAGTGIDITQASLSQGWRVDDIRVVALPTMALWQATTASQFTYNNGLVGSSDSMGSESTGANPATIVWINASGVVTTTTSVNLADALAWPGDFGTGTGNEIPVWIGNPADGDYAAGLAIGQALAAEIKTDFGL